jgi:hypothetical protein
MTPSRCDLLDGLQFPPLDLAVLPVMQGTQRLLLDVGGARHLRPGSASRWNTTRPPAGDALGRGAAPTSGAGASSEAAALAWCCP